MRCINKEKDKVVGDTTTEKQKEHKYLDQYKVVIELALKEKRLGNRSSKAFNTVAWKNIVKISRLKIVIRQYKQHEITLALIKNQNLLKYVICLPLYEISCTSLIAVNLVTKV